MSNILFLELLIDSYSIIDYYYMNRYITVFHYLN